VGEHEAGLAGRVLALVADDAGGVLVVLAAEGVDQAGDAARPPLLHLAEHHRHGASKSSGSGVMSCSTVPSSTRFSATSQMSESGPSSPSSWWMRSKS